MNSPLVTVALSVLNLEDCVEEAIHSVLQQSYLNWELIAIDDASTDGTFDVLKRYEGPKIRVFRNSVNRGTYWNRNLALLWARGEFFTTIDGDDQFHPDRLKIQVEKTADEDASLCHYIRRHPRYPGGKRIYLGHNTLLFRRSLLKEIGYYDTVRFDADSEYIRRIALSRPIVAIPDVLLEYSVREGSLSEAPESGVAADSRGAKIRAHYVESYRAWHQQSERPYLSFPAIRRPFEAGGPNHAVSRDPIIVSLASFPEREASLRQTIDSLLPWADHINLFLNEYKEPPAWLNHAKINIQVGAGASTLEEAKFFRAETKPSYHFVCHDDILYSEEEVELLLSMIEVYHREGIVRLHHRLPSDSQHDDNRSLEQRIFHYRDDEPSGMALDFLSSRALAYHTDKVRFSLDLLTAGVATNLSMSLS